MTTAAAVHAAIVAALEAVSGLTEITAPWVFEAVSSPQFGGGFWVEPAGDDGGQFGGPGAVVTASSVVHMPSRLGIAPGTNMQAALTRMEAARAALRGVLGEARVQPGAYVPVYSEDRKVVDLQFAVEATYINA